MTLIIKGPFSPAKKALLHDGTGGIKWADSGHSDSCSALVQTVREKMQLKISFLLLFALFVGTLAWPGGRGFDEGFGAGGLQRGQGNRGGARGFQGGQQEQDGPVGRSGRQGGFQGDSKKYRSNLYSDDDVYGYDATYPNGEAAYINYRSKDARARRGPEFARTSRAYSRRGGDAEGGPSSFGQQNGYKGAGGMW